MLGRGEVELLETGPVQLTTSAMHATAQAFIAF
jgi:hypothetical protein